MSFIDDILGALGIGGGSLEHIQQMAASVRPEEIEAMAPVFEHGTQTLNNGHGHLESAIDNVVTGWKGDAARAASTSVLDGAMKSRQSAEQSSSAADNVRAYADQLRSTRTQILAIKPVDASFSKAVQASGGPVASALNPGAVAANMAAAQIKKEQHREQAANYLSQMNDESEQFAAQQEATFAPVPPPPGGYDRSRLPKTISFQSPSASGGGGGMPAVNGPSGGGPGSSSTTGRPGPGTTLTPVRPPHGGNDGPGHPGPGPTDPPTVDPPVDLPGDPTIIQGAEPPGGGGPGGPPVALPNPSGSGPGLGAGTVALIGGGAAAIAAGSVAGWNRGGFPGARAAMAGGGADGAGVEGGRAGAGGVEGERGFARGGFGGGADETNGRFGPGARGGVGGFDPEESTLRAGRMSAAAAGEMAAGERGMMPPMGGGAGRRSDEEELDKRPDYLVETDDVWGDGRLAAPPVLG